MKTIKVKMLESVSGEGDEFNGIEGSFSLAPGSEVDIPEDLAQKWAKAGRCLILNAPEAEAPASPEPPATQKKPNGK